MKRFFILLTVSTALAVSTAQAQRQKQECIEIASTMPEPSSNEMALCKSNSTAKSMQIYKDWLHKNNVPYEEESYGLSFNYQGGHFIITDNADDSDFLQLLMLNIMEAYDNNARVLKVANTINKGIKCVKCMIVKDSVWLATEIYLDQTPEIDSIMPHLLNILFGARMRFKEEMAKLHWQYED